MPRFEDLFRSYTRAHGRFVMGDRSASGKIEKKQAWTATGAPTIKDWEGHLSGKGVGLGLLPLLDDNLSVYWGAIDIDRYPVDHAALERDMANLPLTMTKSKSDGAHLWLFLRQPVSAKLVVERLNEWAAALGYGGVEVFPKQTSRNISNKDDVGNWINLPYFGNTRCCVFEGKEVPLEKFLELAEARSVTKEILEKISIVQEQSGQVFQDGPPCLQMITAMGGGAEGSRNNFLFAVGVYHKMKSPDRWREEMRAFNQGYCKPPITEAEISTLIGSLEKKKYNYHCNKAPLVQHCNRPLCCKRPFGVAQEGSDELNITLSGLTKIATSPPRWLVNIDGVRVELDNTEDLARQQRFRRFSIENVHKVPTKLTDKKWDDTIQLLLDKVEVVEAPPEASPQGQFLEHLLRFIEINGQAESRDMLLNGRVYTENGYAYFRANDLYSYLKRERFQELKTSAMYSILNGMGFKRDRFNCKGQTVAYWSVEIQRLGGLQSGEHDVPSFENPFGDK